MTIPAIHQSYARQKSFVLAVWLLIAACLTLWSCEQSRVSPTGDAQGNTQTPAQSDVPMKPGQPGTGNAANGWRSLDDLARGRIAVMTGAAPDLYVTHTFPLAQITRFNSKADFVLALKTGKVDVAIDNDLVIRAIAKENPDLAILADDFYNTPLGAAFRKGDERRQRFDRVLETIQADGTLAEMRNRWFGDDPQIAVMPVIPTLKTGETLRIGTSIFTGLPYIALIDGQYQGFEVELMQRFAAQAGFRLEIVLMEFDALIAALAVGKIDMIVATLSITEERLAKVDFSKPYDYDRSAALVQKRNLALSALATSGQALLASPENIPASSFFDDLRASFQANFFLEQRWRLILNGLWVTVLISVTSTVFGTLLGGLICYLRMSSQSLWQRLGSGYIFLVRGLPVLLLLMLIFYVAFASFNIDPVIVAIIAFGINFSAYVSEMFRTGIESIDRGQTEAGIAIGFTPAQTFLNIVLPQATRRILPVYRGEFISLVKMTSIVGYIGVQDLTKAGDIIRSRTFEAFFPLLMVATIYFLIIWVLGLALDDLDRRTNPKARRTARATA
jgi:polar amino acid transport system substrate-binding protein